jgi:hypothetical protein
MMPRSPTRRQVRRIHVSTSLPKCFHNEGIHHIIQIKNKDVIQGVDAHHERFTLEQSFGVEGRLEFKELTHALRRITLSSNTTVCFVSFNTSTWSFLPPDTTVEGRTGDSVTSAFDTGVGLTPPIPFVDLVVGF